MSTSPTELRALLAKATPGEWKTQAAFFSGVQIGVDSAVDGEYAAVAGEMSMDDARLVVAMYAALPALLDVAAAARVLTSAWHAPGYAQNYPTLKTLIDAVNRLELGSK